MNIWIRSTWTDAGQIAALIDPTSEGGEASGRPLHEWHARLVGEDDLGGAVEFMAHAMSRYDCICWAVRAALETNIVERADPLVVAVLQWIDNPEDEFRRAAADAAETVTNDSPAKLLCLATQFSGGSIAPPDLAAVQPRADICARLAAASLVAGAYALGDPQAALRQILELGEAMVTIP